MAMKSTCPDCGGASVRCVDSRLSSEPNVYRRRVYSCPACDHRFTTYETIVGEAGKPAKIASAQAAVLKFMRDVEVSAREHFGNDSGKFGSSASVGVRLRGKRK